MTADLVEGQPVADRILANLGARIAACRARGMPPSLTALSCGASPASRLYLKKQRERAAQLGILYTEADLPADTPLPGILAAVRGLDSDPAVTGIMIQVPLPEGIPAREVQAALDPTKDVEGVHPVNLGRLLQGLGDLAPCTAVAAVELLRSRVPDLRGAHVVVVGRSEVVGKPAALLLLALGKAAPTVTVCHTGTLDLGAVTRTADFLIVAAGRAGLVRGDMLKPGAGVVDVGIHRVPDAGPDGVQKKDSKGRPLSRTVGDVDFESARGAAGWITPVPGGVGPVTTAVLMRNVVACAETRIVAR